VVLERRPDAGAEYVLANWPGRLSFASPALLALLAGSPV